jgi:alkylation response protein AidB-like acyl-CoA dehydrogenase
VTTTTIDRRSVGTDEEFRAELRQFLEAYHPGKAPRDKAERLAYQRAWSATLYDHGWAGPSWPRELGGMDLPFARQVVYQEELARARGQYERTRALDAALFGKDFEA